MGEYPTPETSVNSVNSVGEYPLPEASVDSVNSVGGLQRAAWVWQECHTLLRKLPQIGTDVHRLGAKTQPKNL